MVYLATLEEWQEQSALLLQARPTTARITTKYNIPNLESKQYAPRTKKAKVEGEKEADRTPRAWLTLKTYCPASGITLKFKTDRAADIGRTIAGLGTLGRHMAALPPKKIEGVYRGGDTRRADDLAVKDEEMTEAPSAEAAAPAETKAPAQATGGGKKKKKNRK